MSIVNVNLNIQHTPEAVRFGSPSDQGRPEVAAQQQADRLEKQVQRQQEQIQRQEATDKTGVNPDRQGRGNEYQKQKSTKGKTQTKKKPQQNSPQSESLFDIRI